MPSFLHPTLFWTFGLPTLGVLAIPVLIHLINMMRHRKVEWAAMEFLLISQKKNRTWVVLKQLLLLLLRMTILAAIVFLVAQPVLRSRWGSLLGTTRTHHIVLLDDSFSMSDRWEDTDAFSEAKKAISRIGAEAGRQMQPQLVTLLRFSRVGRAGRPVEPDLLKQSVGADFAESLDALLVKIEVTQTAVGPIPAIQGVAQLIGEGNEEQRIVYVISDFRARQWDDPAQLRGELTRLDESGAKIHLVDCVDRARPNLAIASLGHAEGIRAAGVPWFMEVAVQNFGNAPVRDVSVILGEDGHGRPAVTLAEIPPGKIAKERFLVHFPTAGFHDISARLESDAVEADNHRYSTVKLPNDVPVLLIDGDIDARDAWYLSGALAPGGAVRTGIRPQIELPRFLSQKPLKDFDAIVVMNVDRLDASAVEALEAYVAAGGGLAFFLGGHTDANFFNDFLYRDGQGLFPAPLSRESELIVDRLETAPDVQVVGHPIFRVFGGKRNPLLQTIRVERYFAVPDDWRPATDSSVQILARLRNGAPLAVERNFDRGRVLALLTTAAPNWNNWARNPSFVVVMQDLLAYLSDRPSAETPRQVGSPLTLILDPAVYRPEVRFVAPQNGAVADVRIDAVRNAEGFWDATLADTDASGFYEALLAPNAGSEETRRFALNVDADEGDLAKLDSEQLAARLEGVNYNFEQAAAFRSSPGEIAGYNLSETLLYVLVLLLIGEQILAWSAGYHPSRRRSLTQGGSP